jgi:hypothetical protein
VKLASSKYLSDKTAGYIVFSTRSNRASSCSLLKKEISM